MSQIWDTCKYGKLYVFKVKLTACKPVPFGKGAFSIDLFSERGHDNFHRVTTPESVSIPLKT